MFQLLHPVMNYARSLHKRLTKASAKKKSKRGAAVPAKKKSAAAKPIAAKRKPRGQTVGRLGKLQISWHPWERHQGNRWSRWGGLEGEGFLHLSVDKTGSAWEWSVIPEYNGDDRLPVKYRQGFGGPATSADVGKSKADAAVGLE